MRHAQLVIGPAGCGKSTYCAALAQYGADNNRVIDVVNLDPAAEHFSYTPLADIRDLINIDDAMDDEELKFGPNGGLVFCIEYLVANSDWLQEQLGDTDDDYIIFDCPGQIELYTHLTAMKQLVELLKNWDFRICSVYVGDCQFMTDGPKFLSGTMAALSMMANLDLPHVNVLSKMDLLTKSAKRQMDRFLDPDPHFLLADLESTSTKWNEKYRSLTESIGNLILDFSLVKFYPLDIRKEGNLADILLTIDNAIQYGEDADVKMRDFDPPEEEDDDYQPDM